MAYRLYKPQPLQFVQLFRHLLSQVVRLARVFTGVIEFPVVVVEFRDFLAPEEPGRTVSRNRGPALVVDPAVAEHLEVLCLVPLGCLGVVLNEYAMLTPSKGFCWTPFTKAGSGRPAASRIVDATSIT